MYNYIYSNCLPLYFTTTDNNDLISNELVTTLTVGNDLVTMVTISNDC